MDSKGLAALPPSAHSPEYRPAAVRKRRILPGRLAALQEAHRADQGPVLLYNLGVCHFWLGDKAAAAACFREADAANAADLLCAQCGAVHPRLAYAFCVQGEERAAALRRYAPERNDMELWDYVLLCVQCEAYAMAAPVLPELVSQWALTDQTLAMTALCLRHVPEERSASCAAFRTSFRRSGTGCCTCSGMPTSAHALRQASHFFRRPQPTRGISRKNAFEKPAVREKNAAALSERLVQGNSTAEGHWCAARTRLMCHCEEQSDVAISGRHLRPRASHRRPHTPCRWRRPRRPAV